jgi:hypothetical protein
MIKNHNRLKEKAIKVKGVQEVIQNTEQLEHFKTMPCTIYMCILTAS